MSLEETAKRLITKAEEYRALAAHHRDQGESAAEAQLDLAWLSSSWSNSS
jgi:hypothetical protein